MTTHAKKSEHVHTHSKTASEASKAAKTVSAMTEPAKKMQEKALETGRENAGKLMHAAADINHAAAEYRKISSGHVDALVESGEATSRIAHHMSTEVMESANRIFLEFAEISQEAMTCKTMEDMVRLQRTLMRKMSDNYLQTASTLCGLLFDSCDKALDSLSERTAAASKQMHKALAA